MARGIHHGHHHQRRFAKRRATRDRGRVRQEPFALGSAPLAGLRRTAPAPAGPAGRTGHADEARAARAAVVPPNPGTGRAGEHNIRAQTDAAPLHGEVPDARTACQIHIAATCGVTDVIDPKPEHKAINARIAALDGVGAAGANVVARLMAQAETAAAITAITASTVAATSAATAAACSASSVACH